MTAPMSDSGRGIPRYDLSLEERQRDEFLHLLEQPARDLPRLRALMAEPSPFEPTDHATDRAGEGV